MTQETLYKECPLCAQSPVVARGGGEYSCESCGLTLKDRSVLGLFKKGQYGVEMLGHQTYGLADNALKDVSLASDPLKVAIGNVYTDQQLADIAAGDIDVIKPVQTILAQIILEQLREECFVNVNGVRRGRGKPLEGDSSYWPSNPVSESELTWLDEGNLFCTTNRLVLPSNQFTFIRLGRKISAVQAFTNGVAIQLKGDEFSTHFVGCYAHEAALVAAYVMGKVPLLRPKTDERRKTVDER